MTHQHILITTTTETRDHARLMARSLIDERLAACVEIQTVDSLYQWKGDVCDTVEYVLVIKTRADLYPQIENRIRALHTYELPQIVAIPIVAGSPDYLNWIDQETRKQTS